MAAELPGVLKSWFETNDEPTQTEFWSLIDSFRHVLVKITIDDLEANLRALILNGGGNGGGGASSFSQLLGSPTDNAALAAALAALVVKDGVKVLSSNDYTDADRAKVQAWQEKYLGKYTTLSQANGIVGFAGSYIVVDQGAGYDAREYIWDSTDSKWVPSSNTGASSFGQLSGAPTDNAALAAALAERVMKSIENTFTAKQIFQAGINLGASATEALLVKGVNGDVNTNYSIKPRMVYEPAIIAALNAIPDGSFTVSKPTYDISGPGILMEKDRYYIDVPRRRIYTALADNIVYLTYMQEG